MDELARDSQITEMDAYTNVRSDQTSKSLVKVVQDEEVVFSSLDPDGMQASSYHPGADIMTVVKQAVRGDVNRTWISTASNTILEHVSEESVAEPSWPFGSLMRGTSSSAKATNHEHSHTFVKRLQSSPSSGLHASSPPSSPKGNASPTRTVPTVKPSTPVNEAAHAATLSKPSDLEKRHFITASPLRSLNRVSSQRSDSAALVYPPSTATSSASSPSSPPQLQPIRNVSTSQPRNTPVSPVRTRDAPAPSDDMRQFEAAPPQASKESQLPDDAPYPWPREPSRTSNPVPLHAQPKHATDADARKRDFGLSFRSLYSDVGDGDSFDESLDEGVRSAGVVAEAAGKVIEPLKHEEPNEYAELTQEERSQPGASFSNANSLMSSSPAHSDIAAMCEEIALDVEEDVDLFCGLNT
ncbi:hypothetical protein BC830DRAFT_1087274 [Chytriomyces sp. MP71]|nr:hypothetical protein BC830DRAFT_1087274 [Chytriomyces sp. MP71]